MRSAGRVIQGGLNSLMYRQRAVLVQTVDVVLLIGSWWCSWSSCCLEADDGLLGFDSGSCVC